MGFKYAGSTFPLDAGSHTTLLPVCDPSLAKILDFLRFGILRYANDAIVSMVAVAPVDGSASNLQSAVAQVIPADPETVANVAQLQFPMLAGWSVSTQYNQRTLNWISDKRTVRVAYVLRPLNPVQTILWTPILNSISQICNAMLKAGHDVDYNGDERVLLDNNITDARLMSADFGHYDFHNKKEPPYFPAWVAELEVTEKQQPYTAGLVDFEGADFTATHQSFGDVSTTIAANALAGATSIQVVSSEGFEANDVIRIGQDTARDETISVVAAPDATHLTLAAAGLAFAHTLAQADVVKKNPVTIVRAKTEVG